MANTTNPTVIRMNQASGAFQRWELARFDEPEVIEPTEVLPPIEAQTSTETPTQAPDTIEIAPGVSLPTAEDIERIQQDAFKEGYAAGYEEGSARGRLEAAELHQLLQSMNSAFQQLDQEVAEELQALALEVARQVVRDSLSAKPESVLTIVREALVQVPQQGATIHVHPADAKLIRQYLGDNTHDQQRVVEDENIMQGGCVIESAGGQIDAQVHTRWRRVVEGLSRSAAQFNDE